MKHWFLGCMVLICLAPLSMRYSLAEEYPFHSEQDIAGAQSGEMLIKIGIFQIGEERYDTDYCSMVVPENRNSSDSRLIHLPVVRIRSKNDKPKEPAGQRRMQAPHVPQAVLKHQAKGSSAYGRGVGSIRALVTTLPSQ
jgi:hypothetical protein